MASNYCQLSPNSPPKKQPGFRLKRFTAWIGNCSFFKRRCDARFKVWDRKSPFPTWVATNQRSNCTSIDQRHRFWSSWGCALCGITLCVGCFEPPHIHGWERIMIKDGAHEIQIWATEQGTELLRLPSSQAIVLMFLLLHIEFIIQNSLFPKLRSVLIACYGHIVSANCEMQSHFQFQPWICEFFFSSEKLHPVCAPIDVIH